MSHEWKALANAIVHYQVNPNSSRIAIVCEKCKNEYMFVRYKDDVNGDSEFDRFTVYLLVCPDCGHVELDVIGTYDLTENGWGLQSVMESVHKYFVQLREMQHVTEE